MNLEAYLVATNNTLDTVAMYWSGDGHFIDYRPESGDMITVFDDCAAHVSELRVVYEDQAWHGPRLTLDFDL